MSTAPARDVINLQYATDAIEANKQKRTIRHIVGSDDVDRHNTVIRPDGMTLKIRTDDGQEIFPAVLWEHGQDALRGRLPVAKSIAIEEGRFRGKSVIVADTAFKEDPFSEQLWQFYADRTLNGWSVNVIPLQEMDRPTKRELAAQPELARCAGIYRRSELVEYSAVAIHSNRAAVTQQVFRSLAAAAGQMAPRTSDLPTLDRAHRAALVRGLASGIIRTAAREGRDAGLSDAEIMRLINQLRLKFELGRWQNLVEHQDEMEARKKLYARPESLGPALSYRTGHGCYIVELAGKRVARVDNEAEARAMCGL